MSLPSCHCFRVVGDGLVFLEELIYTSPATWLVGVYRTIKYDRAVSREFHSLVSRLLPGQQSQSLYYFH
jgi:hypothetical protein